MGTIIAGGHKLKVEVDKAHERIRILRQSSAIKEGRNFTHYSRKTGYEVHLDSYENPEVTTYHRSVTLFCRGDIHSRDDWWAHLPTCDLDAVCMAIIETVTAFNGTASDREDV